MDLGKQNKTKAICTIHFHSLTGQNNKTRNTGINSGNISLVLTIIIPSSLQ